MTMGINSKTMPAIPSLYFSLARASRLRTTISVATIAPIEMKSHITWLTASSGLSLVTKAMPMPERPKVTGSITGSAPGARKRIATWAIAKAAKRPKGTESVSNESWVLAFIVYIA